MRSNLFISLVLILIGLWIWLSNIGILNFSRDWPFILIFIGLYLLLRGSKKPEDKVKKIINDLEKGKIKPEEALRRIKEEEKNEK